MGRGDKKSKKGKIFAGSFGNTRPHHKGRKSKGVANATPTPAPAPGRKRP